MSVDGFDHLYVESRHFPEALRFWKALGFSVDSEWGGEGHRACRLTSGSAAVVLAEVDPSGSPQGATLHFAAADLETLDARLPGAGEVDVVAPLADTHWGTRWIRVRDPDGNLYCLEAPRD